LSGVFLQGKRAQHEPMQNYSRIYACDKSRIVLKKSSGRSLKKQPCRDVAHVRQGHTAI